MKSRLNWAGVTDYFRDIIDAFIGDPFVFQCYAAALTITFTLCVASRLRPLVVCALFLIVGWVIIRFWRMTFPSPFTAVLLLADLISMYLLLYLHRRSGSKAYKHMALIHLGFVVVHVCGTFFSFGGFYFGAERSDAWGEAFWRNRVFDLCLLYLVGSSLFKFNILNNSSARRVFRKTCNNDKFYRENKASMLDNPQRFWLGKASQ